VKDVLKIVSNNILDAERFLRDYPVVFDITFELTNECGNTIRLEWDFKKKRIFVWPIGSNGGLDDPFEMSQLKVVDRIMYHNYLPAFLKYCVNFQSQTFS
jgi:hypothetical protein